MFKTLATVALIGATEAIKIAEVGEIKNQYDAEEVLAAAQSGDYSREDVEGLFEHVSDKMEGKDFTVAIDWAADNGIGFEQVMGALEGAEVAGAFNKHDIYDATMEICCHYSPSHQDLDEMLHYAGKALNITEEQGDQLFERAGEVFDISQEEFDQAVDDCVAVGKKCAAKEAKPCPKADGEKQERPVAEAVLAQEEEEESESVVVAHLKEIDWENVDPEEAANFLKENADEIEEALKAEQEEVVAFLKEHEGAIREFVEENEDEIKEFAAEFEKHLGQKINWDEVKDAVEDYVSE